MKINRRQFALGSAALALSPTAFAQGLFRVPDGVKYRSALLHLGMNMWGGYRAPGEPVDPDLKYGKSRCMFDEGVWRRTTDLMQKRRFNHAVIDLGGETLVQATVFNDAAQMIPLRFSSTSIDLSPLPAGHYLLHLLTRSGKQYSKQLIVTR